MNIPFSSMRLMRPSVFPLVGAIVALNCPTASAGVLSAVGIDQNDPSWRTTTTAKPLDGNGDNVYGTNGYFLPRFNTTAAGTVAFSTVTGSAAP